MKRFGGFTLIELMVVISILALLAVGFFVNFKSFGEDAALKNTASDIQSALRLAQSNATTGVKCGNNGGASWYIQFNGRSTFNLRCSTQGDFDPPVRKWSIPLPVYISEINGIRPTPCSSSFTPLGTIAVGIYANFSYLGGKANFIDRDLTKDCLGKSTTMVIKLKKSSDEGALKTVTLDKGGSVDVQ